MGGGDFIWSFEYRSVMMGFGVWYNHDLHRVFMGFGAVEDTSFTPIGVCLLNDFSMPALTEQGYRGIFTEIVLNCLELTISTGTKLGVPSDVIEFFKLFKNDFIDVSDVMESEFIYRTITIFKTYYPNKVLH